MLLVAEQVPRQGPLQILKNSVKRSTSSSGTFHRMSFPNNYFYGHPAMFGAVSRMHFAAQPVAEFRRAIATGAAAVQTFI